MTRSLTIVLVAEEAAGVQALRLIAAREGVDLAAVLTSAPTGTERGLAVADVAKKLGCRVLPADRVRDPAFTGWLKDEAVDLLINVHALHIARGDVLAVPVIGAFNLHPGPLPRYAGLNAPSWAVMNRETRHAVTLHWMEATIDTGAVAYQAGFDLAPNATGLSCSLQCVRLGVPLIGELISTALDEPSTIPRQPQADGARAFYKKSDVPFGGRIDWARPAAEIDAFVRAADYHPMPSPWGSPRTALGKMPLDVVKVKRTGRTCTAMPGTLKMDETGAIRVATGDEWLVLERVLKAGRIQPPAELYRPGDRLSSF